MCLWSFDGSQSALKKAMLLHWVSIHWEVYISDLMMSAIFIVPGLLFDRLFINHIQAPLVVLYLPHFLSTMFELPNCMKSHYN